MSKVTAVQVQPTKLTGGGVEVVSFKDRTCKATHWSLYLRHEGGTVEWVKDIPLGKQTASDVYGEAMLAAAKLSMDHYVPIEQVL